MEQELNDFLTYHMTVKNSSGNTIQAYRNDLKKFLIYLGKQNIISPTKISETALNSYILIMEKEGFSPASVSRNIASIKGFMLYLLKKGIIPFDPTERLKAPRTDKKIPKVINIPFIEQLLIQPDINTKKGIRDKAMLELLYATGIKVSELLEIKMEDINLSNRYLCCGKRKERVIPIGKPAVEAIQQYLLLRDEYNSNHLDILFLNTSGQKLTRQGIWKIIKGYARELGFENIMPNTIRNSFAAHMLENGAGLGSIQEFMGYSNLASAQLYLNQDHKNSREVYHDTHPRN